MNTRFSDRYKNYLIFVYSVFFWSGFHSSCYNNFYSLESFREKESSSTFYIFWQRFRQSFPLRINEKKECKSGKVDSFLFGSLLGSDLSCFSHYPTFAAQSKEIANRVGGTKKKSAPGTTRKVRGSFFYLKLRKHYRAL